MNRPPPIDRRTRENGGEIGHRAQVTKSPRTISLEDAQLKATKAAQEILVYIHTRPRPGMCSGRGSKRERRGERRTICVSSLEKHLRIPPSLPPSATAARRRKKFFCTQGMKKVRRRARREKTQVKMISSGGKMGGEGRRKCAPFRFRLYPSYITC